MIPPISTAMKDGYVFDYEYMKRKIPQFVETSLKYTITFCVFMGDSIPSWDGFPSFREFSWTERDGTILKQNCFT